MNKPIYDIMIQGFLTLGRRDLINGLPQQRGQDGRFACVAKAQHQHVIHWAWRCILHEQAPIELQLNEVIENEQSYQG